MVDGDDDKGNASMGEKTERTNAEGHVVDNEKAMSGNDGMCDGSVMEDEDIVHPEDGEHDGKKRTETGRGEWVMPTLADFNRILWRHIASVDGWCPTCIATEDFCIRAMLMDIEDLRGMFHLETIDPPEQNLWEYFVDNDGERDTLNRIIENGGFAENFYSGRDIDVTPALLVRPLVSTIYCMSDASCGKAPDEDGLVQMPFPFPFFGESEEVPKESPEERERKRQERKKTRCAAKKEKRRQERQAAKAAVAKGQEPETNQQ